MQSNPLRSMGFAFHGARWFQGFIALPKFLPGKLGNLIVLAANLCNWQL